MSAGYGYFRIEFYTGNGSADVDAAKRAYDWCKENLDWFNGDDEGMPFLLKDNSFVVNEDVSLNGTGGLDIKNGDIPDNVTWLAKAFNAVKATRLVASLWQDFGETSVDMNTYYEGVWERGKQFNYYLVDGFNTSIYPAWYNGHIIDNDFNHTYRKLLAAFKNEKTGEEILAGDLTSEEPAGFGEITKGTLKIGDVSFAAEINMDSVELQSDVDKAEVVKAFVSVLKKSKEYSDVNETDWTFCGFKSCRSFFELYGSNPAVADYKELYDNGSVHGGEIIPETNTDNTSVKTVFINNADEDGYPEFDDDFDFDELKGASVVFGENIRKLCFGNYEDAEGVSCSDIKSVRFSKNLKYIGGGSFEYCTCLEEIIYDGTMEEWESVDVEEKAFCWGGCYGDGDSIPREFIPADEIKCSDGEVPIDKSDEGIFIDADEYEDEDW